MSHIKESSVEIANAHNDVWDALVEIIAKVGNIEDEETLACIKLLIGEIRILEVENAVRFGGAGRGRKIQLLNHYKKDSLAMATALRKSTILKKEPDE